MSANIRTRLQWIVAFVAFIALLSVAFGQLKPTAQVIAVDAGAKTVTAREASGQTFRFVVQNPALLKAIKVGQAVYANFATKQVSLDGRTVAGQMIAPPAPALPARVTPAAPAKGVAPTVLPRSAAPSPIAAKASGSTGDEQSAGGPVNLAPPPVASVIGQPQITLLKRQENLELRHIVANVNGQQVESDIIHLTGPQAIESAYQQKLLPEAARDALLEHAKNLDEGDAPIYIVNKQIAEAWAKTHTPLPKSAPTSLSMPRRRVRENGPRLVYASYVPDPDPQSVGGALKHAGGELSKDAKHAEKEASKDAEHVGGQISDAYKHATGQTTKWWRHWQSEATKDFEKVEDCWVDHKLSVRKKVNLRDPNLAYTADLSSKNLGQGTVTFGLPIDHLEMEAEASVFYIPCMAVVSAGVPLPFFIRPRDISVQNGYLSMGANITTDVQQIAFNGSKEFFTPPAITLIPQSVIMAGPVPIVLEAYLYLRGGIRYTGALDVQSNFTASTKKEGPFSFTCNGHGCKHAFSEIQTVPQISDQPSMRTKLAGRVNLEPYFWAAVQVGVYNGLLMARAGPEVAINGDLWAYDGSSCGTTTGAAPAEVKALTADIDAKVYATWQVWTLGQIDPHTGDYFKPTKDFPKGREIAHDRHLLFAPFHLFFKDLTGSTALAPLVTPSAATASAQPASYNVRMRPCYPYDDDVQYRVEWAGKSAVGTASTNSTSAAQLSATYWGSPQKDVLVTPGGIAPGDYTLSITPIGDKHKRTFPPSQTTRLAVHVGGATRAQSRPTPVTAAVDHK